MDDTDRSEVGREPFFRGRDKEYTVFQKAASMLKANRVGGGTMIFQGAPGAGKTALMQECMEAVRLHSTPDQPWVAASVDPATLQSPVAVIKSLTEAANRERERLARIAPQNTASKLDELTKRSKRLFAELLGRGFSVGIAGVGASLGAKPNSGQGQEGIYSEIIFLDAAPLFENIRLVVFIDEAQNTPINESTKAVLDKLHRKTEGINLVAAFFGLSDTESMLVECGISRPPDERVVNLELLTYEETSEAIRSIFESYNFTGSLENPEVWIERLAKLSQGWPQHINRVSVAACRVIAKHEGYPIKDELLEHVLQEGRKSKENYYDMILRRCSAQPWIYKQLAIAAEKNEGILDLDCILQVAQHARTKKGMPVDDFLTDALHAGVLIETRHPPSYYQIPVPSLGDYLRSLKQEPPLDMI
ncbi:MAG: hypothetical protein OXF20_04405 [Gammaproteobacteria bacterium]|nr:hypothetical protein [Gammaproteobacteria bacterium]